MTYEEVVSALPLMSTEQHLLLIQEIARLMLLELRPKEDFPSQAPIVRGLMGTLSPDVSVEDYWRYIDEKYGQGLPPETP